MTKKSNGAEVVEALGRGALVVIPTDTVYGIAAVPHVVGAASRIFSAKGRPEGKPLAVLAAELEDIEAVATLDERARTLAARFWPGPLTLVVPRATTFTHDLGSGAGDTVAVRIPALELTRSLLRDTGPLAVTSANRSGEHPATTVAEARAAFGDSVEIYVDGGVCAGEPSTVVFLQGHARVLRAGAIPAEEIAANL